MPLGGVAIVNRSLRKREAVMRAGINLDLGIGTVVFHSLCHFLDDLARRVNIGFGAAEIELGLGLSPGKMRAVGLGGGKMGSIDRGCRFDALWKVGCGVDRIAPAHAVADGTDNAGARGGLA